MPAEILTLKKQEKNEKCNILNPEELKKVNHWFGMFSMEITTTGKRFFFRMEYDLMYKSYRYFSEPHFYEVIPENHPCHLYFDIEFLFAEHNDFDGDKLVNDLILLVDDKLFSLFGRTDYEIIDLEATSEKKFSRHLIFHSDTFMFRNNSHVGYFVQTEILTHPEFAQIVDPAVYSKNRNFRCIWCTKKANGSNYPLIPKDKTNSKPSFSNLEYFLKTLIAYPPKTNPHLIGYPHIDNPPISKQVKTSTVQIKASNQPSDNQKKGSSGDKQDIEQFAIKSFAPNGYISKISYSPEFDTISLFVEGSKYCQNIGREHKSNHIYLICKLSQGYITQRCFDPDCRGYESPPVEIPYILLQNLRQKYLPTNYDPSLIIQNYQKKAPKGLSSIEKIILENSID